MTQEEEATLLPSLISVAIKIAPVPSIAPVDNEEVPAVAVDQAHALSMYVSTVPVGGRSSEGSSPCMR